MTRPPWNGDDVPSVFAVIGGVNGQPGMAQFQFLAGNKWIDGTHHRSATRGFLGCVTLQTTAPMPSSRSPRHRRPDSAFAHRMHNGSTPDPGMPGVYAGPDNQGVYAGPRPLPRAGCRRAERARL